MKNLSYEEKLRLAKEALESGSYDKETIEYIFPELKESEDEKIRKDIIRVFTGEIPYTSKEENEKYITWLEKQGASYTKEEVDDAYLKGINDAKNEIEKQHEANYQIRKDIATFIFNYRGDIKDRAKWMDYLGIKISFVEKQESVNKNKVVKGSIPDVATFSGQNLAWSEEDEKNLTRAIWYVENPALNVVKDTMLSEWLKSLKERVHPQPHWKPSEEQIQCLHDAIEHYHTNGYPASKLNELYEQMSKIYKL